MLLYVSMKDGFLLWYGCPAQSREARKHDTFNGDQMGKWAERWSASSSFTDLQHLGKGKDDLYEIT